MRQLAGRRVGVSAAGRYDVVMRHAALLLLGLFVGAILVTWLLSSSTPPVVIQEPGPRVVSLSPALSRTAVLLGLEDRLVGRSRFCSFLDESVPVVGDLLAIDYERLIAVAPTDLIVQPSASGIDPALQRLAREHDWSLHSFPGLNDLGDVFAMTRALARAMTDEGPARDAAVARAETLDAQLAAALDASTPGFTGRVLILHAVDPVGAFGADTYLDEMLGRLGATNAVTGSGWLTLSLEDVIELDPDAIVLVRLTPSSWEDAAGALARLDCRAVRDGRVAVLAHPDVLYPSPALAEVAERLRDLLKKWKRDAGASRRAGEGRTGEQ